MGFLGRLLRRSDFRVTLDKQNSTFVYSEGSRRLIIPGERMADGYAVYASTIRQWDTPEGDAIDEVERDRITANIKSYFVDRGRNLYLS